MNRLKILNHIAASRRATQYLEIGVASGAVFRAVECPVKHGVDPHVRCDYQMTSDDFFAGHCSLNYDLIFIDGLHVADTVMRDLYHALQRLNERGVVVLHDCLPSNEIQQRVPSESRIWSGDVWKAFAQFRARHPEVTSYTVDTDHGCGIVERPAHDLVPQVYRVNPDYTWDAFCKHRDQWLAVTAITEFRRRFPLPGGGPNGATD